MANTVDPQRDAKVRSCIDLVNSLRALGLDQDLDLPAVAVIGDKNSGKSSVLEALSGVELPRGREYPIVLQMRRTKVEEDWCGLVTYQKMDKIVKQKSISSPEDVKTTIEQVKPSNFSVSSEGFLKLEIVSSNIPNLTLIDLPSIPTDPKSQVKLKSFLKSFIMKKCILILVVVPCNVTVAKTEAMQLVNTVDPSGLRTLVVLTKTDLVDKDKEKVILDTVQNKVLPLKKGFMIVKCLDQELKATEMSAMKREKAFFKDHHLFVTLYEDGYATVPKLAERLTLELQRHIEKSLPTLKETIKQAIHQDNATLKTYGTAPPNDEAGKLTFLTDKVTSFIEDASSFLTGDLLELIDKTIFSEWRAIVKNSEDTFCRKLEEEVAQYELKHSDRIQSGFINYNLFKGMAKDHIKLLEEPAVLILRDVREMVKKELGTLVENSFYGFSNLWFTSWRKIDGVSLEREKAAETTVRMQFKMEEFLHAGDKMWWNTKREVTSGTTNDKCDILYNMMDQLKSHHHIVSQRLENQIPLVISYQMLHEFAAQIQKDMQKMLQNKPDTGVLLKEDSNINQKRDKTRSHFKRLTKAHMLLS